MLTNWIGWGMKPHEAKTWMVDLAIRAMGLYGNGLALNARTAP